MKNLSLADTRKVTGGDKDESINEQIGDGVTDALDNIGDAIDDLVDKINSHHHNDNDHCKI